MRQLGELALRLIEQWPGTVLGVFGVAALSAVLGVDYRVGHSYEDWIDRHDPAALEYREMKSTFGDADTLQVAFERRALTADSISGYFDLVADLRERDGVLNLFEPAELFLDADEANPPGDEAAHEFRLQRRGRAPDFRNVLIAQDANTLGALLLLDPDRKDLTTELLAAVTKGFSQLALRPALAGTVVVSEALKDAIGHDLAVVALLLLATSLGLLLLLFRDLLATVAVLLGTALSTLFAFAITSLLGLTINLLTLLLVPLVFCVSLTTAIHLLARRADGSWQLREAYLRVLPPLVIATVTSAIGCLAFANAPQSIVARMGLVMPAAVLVTFLTMMLAVPALLVRCGRVACPAAASPGWTWIPGSRVQRLVSILLLLSTILGVWHLPSLTREPDAFKFFAEDTPIVRDYRYVEGRLSGMLVVDLVIRATDGASVTGNEHRTVVEALIARLRTLPGLTTVVSGYDLLQMPGSMEAMPSGLGGAFFTPDRLATRLSLRFRNADGHPYAESARAIRQAWDSLAPRGLSLSVTGLIPLILAAQDELLAVQGTTLIAGLALVCALLIPVFRSTRLFVLAVIAIFVPLVIAAGAMSWLGIPLNSINLFVGSVILGLVVDDAIYILHAYQSHGAFGPALDEVGTALSLSSLVMGLAFATLACTQLLPIQQFGALSVIVVAAAWACDTCLLPTLLARRVHA